MKDIMGRINFPFYQPLAARANSTLMNYWFIINTQQLNHNFIFSGIVDDPEDGEVWEWVFKVSGKPG